MFPHNTHFAPVFFGGRFHLRRSVQSVQSQISYFDYSCIVQNHLSFFRHSVACSFRSHCSITSVHFGFLWPMLMPASSSDRGGAQSIDGGNVASGGNAMGPWVPICGIGLEGFLRAVATKHERPAVHDVVSLTHSDA